jgi:hypothetical protein
MKENTRCFTQANHTPVLIPDSITQLGQIADTELAADILAHTDILHLAIHPSMKQLAPYLSTPDAITTLGDMSTDISTEEYAYSWTQTRDFTTTGHSGLHFGHMKASSYLDHRTAETDRRFVLLHFQLPYCLIAMVAPSSTCNIRRYPTILLR